MLIQMAEHGLVFSLRDRGRRMRAEVLEKMSTSPRETLVLDFDQVRSVSNSFADEFVGVLAESMAPNTPEVINASPGVAKRIEGSLRRRNLDVDQILAAILVNA
ncbi:MAG: STAS-like domain-containing protein [Solirubrobacteraceae bacterium]